MNIYLIAVLSLCACYRSESCQQMVHGVFNTHEHLTAVLCSALATAPVMSADGSWVFALMNI
jgi:hypothetical protein